MEENLPVVLFVDDEQNILKSIRRELFSAEFELLLANGGKEGLRYLADDPDIAIVVSDLRMPEMDGFEFLREVKSQYPDTERIILSGFVDEETILKSITKGIATTYITKPWEDGLLEDTIDHILELREKLKGKDLLAQINKIEKLPTLPNIYNLLMQAISAEKSIKEIAHIIEQDVSLTAKVLQIANSAFYGFRRTTSLVRAIMVIGLHTLRDVVLTFSITNQMDWTETQKEHLKEISAHSMVMNRLISLYYRQKMHRPLPAEFSSVGITHDIGKIILLQYFSQNYTDILNHMQENDLDFYESEIKLGYEGQTHNEMGAFFLKQWNLPSSNCEVALYHHTPDLASESFKTLMSAVFFADRFTNEVLKKRNGFVDLSMFSFSELSRSALEEMESLVRREFDEYSELY